jgi:hypothetical protein
MSYDAMIDSFLEDFSTYKEIGEERGVSRQRVHQIVTRELDNSVGRDHRDKLLEVRGIIKNLNIVTCECGKITHIPPNNTYCSVECARSAVRQYTKEEGIRLLRMLALSVGRTPTVRELVEDPNTPSLTWYQKKFGSWRNAVKAASLIPRNSGTRA